MAKGMGMISSAGAKATSLIADETNQAGVGQNTYGHPTDELLAVLAANAITAVRTDERGLILVAPGLRLWTARDGP